MRYSGWSSLAISAFSALLLVGRASAHVIAMPTFIPSGSSRSVSFVGPNERSDPMTGFTVTAPAGVEIEHAHPVSGWTETFDASKATWTGGKLGARREIDFGVTLKATADPGIVQLQVKQLYGDGGIVTWPVALTIVPAEKSPSENFALAGVVGLIGVLVVIAVAMLALRRRAPARNEPVE